jgi:hypothetical protein
MMFWADIILHQRELVRKLPKDVVALEWGYEANHPFNRDGKTFRSAGIPFYVCPGTSGWNSLTGRTANCLGNLANAAVNGLRHKAVGYLNTDWGDGGHHQYLPVSYTGMLAGAAYSWCYKSNSKADVVRALNDLVFSDDTGVMGKILFEAGKVLELIPTRHMNQSIFNGLLFSPLGTEKYLDGVSVKLLKSALKRFGELEGKIAASRARVCDAGLVKREIKNGIAMAKHGVRRGLAGLDKRQFDKNAMRRELKRIIARHKDLWLARNRPGGLPESSSRLRNLLKEYA